MKNILVKATVYNPTTDTTDTLRMSAAWADETGTLVDGYQWLPVVTEGPKIQISIFSNGELAPTNVSYGDLTFKVDTLSANASWLNLDWSGATVEAWVADMGTLWAGYTKIYEGRAGAIEREDAMAKVPLLGNDAILDTNLLTATYAGTGGAEGGTNLKGVLKPRAYGYCRNVDPVLLDQAYLIYQFHDGAADSVSMVYENALEVNATAAATVSTYTALRDLTLNPGEWAAAPAVGLFRLGGQPSGKVTADVTGWKSGTLGLAGSGIVREILAASGLSTAKINAASFNSTLPDDWCLYLRDQISVRDAATLALAGFGYLFTDATGVFYAGNFWSSKSPTALKADRSSVPLVRNVTQLAAAAPVTSVRVGYEPCWSPHSAGEITEIVGEIGPEGFTTAKVFLFQRSATAPTLPSTPITYTFDTGVATGLTNGWTTEVPTGTNPLYVTAATASAQGSSDTIAAAEWASPVIMAQDGSAGIAGLNSATIYLYQRATSAPAVPASTLTYTFATGALTGTLGSWSQTIPTGSNPLYITTATAIANTSTDTIATGEWATPRILAQDGSTGPAGVSAAQVFIYQRAASTPTLPSATTTYTFSSGTITGLNNGWVTTPPAGSNPLYVAAATASGTGTTDTIAAGEWSAPVVLAQDGATGAAGLNSATAYLYQRAASSPAVPSTALTYTFATGVLSGTLGSWTQTIPAANGQPCWITLATAASTTATDSIANTEWATPSILVQDGAAGAAGLNSATVMIYQRAASAPALPSVTTTYTFATSALTGLNNGWTTTIPAGSNPLYVSVATASSNAATDTIASGEWASAVVMAQDGSAGAAGTNSASVFLYQRAASAPSVPASTTTYTFATSTLSGTLGSWTQTVPAGSNPLYVTTASAVSNTSTDTIATGEWATPRILAQDGATGATGPTGPTGSTGAAGTDGNSALAIELYMSSASGAPALPTNTAVWNFSAGGYFSTAPNNGWTRTRPNVGTTTASVYSITVTKTYTGSPSTISIAPADYSAAVKVSGGVGNLDTIDWSGSYWNNRDIWLTDGRIGTGLTSGGLLAQDIPFNRVPQSLLAPNLIKDPTFSQGSGQGVWVTTVTGLSGAVCDFATTATHPTQLNALGASNAARFVGTGTTNSTGSVKYYVMRTDDLIPVSDNQRLAFSVDYYCSSAVSTPASTVCVAYCYDSNGTILNYPSAVIHGGTLSTGKYTKSGLIAALPAGTAKVYLSIQVPVANGGSYTGTVFYSNLNVFPALDLDNAVLDGSTYTRFLNTERTNLTAARLNIAQSGGGLFSAHTYTNTAPTSGVHNPDLATTPVAGYTVASDGNSVLMNGANSAVQLAPIVNLPMETGVIYEFEADYEVVADGGGTSVWDYTREADSSLAFVQSSGAISSLAKKNLTTGAKGTIRWRVGKGVGTLADYNVASNTRYIRPLVLVNRASTHTGNNTSAQTRIYAVRWTRDFVSGVAASRFTRTNGTFLTDADVTVPALSTTGQLTVGGVNYGAVTGSGLGVGDLGFLNTIALTDARITAKSLANLDSTADTKLTGIQAGATVGAAWGSNLTGRPTELTDGRISLGLTSAGYVARNIPMPRIPADAVAPNLVPNPNFSDSTDFTVLNYGFGTATFEDYSTDAAGCAGVSSPNALRMAGNGSTNSSGVTRYLNAVNARGFPAVAGVTTYAVAIDYFCSSAWSSGSPLQAQAVVYDAGGSIISYLAVNIGSSFATNASGTIKGTITLPANAASVKMGVQAAILNGGSISGTMYFSKYRVMPQFNLDNDVIDGSTYARTSVTDKGNYLKGYNLTVAGSGQRIANSRSLAPVNAMNNGYKNTSSVTYTVTAGTPASATISVAAGTVYIGSSSVSYNAMSANVTGTNGSTVVYFLYVQESTDTSTWGGSKTLLTTTNGTTLYQNDNNVWIGSVSVTYPASGSGGGSGGGGGGGYCVDCYSWMPDNRLAGDYEAGDALKVIDEETWAGSTYATVLSNRLIDAECVLLASESGIELIVSSETPCTVLSGASVPACDLLGHKLPVEDEDGFRWESITGVEPLGTRTVAYLSAGGRTYAAGLNRGRFIYTHNVDKP